MDREQELALLRIAIASLANGPNTTPSSDGSPSEPSEAPRSIDVSAYLDPDRYAREREIEHQSRLNLVAHGSELPAPGSFVTRDVVGAPVVLIRDDDGVIRAFLNVCRHRGATVELRARGTCKRLVCPYHAWTYGRDGSLVHVRHESGFPGLDRTRSGLVPLTTQVRGGFVWVCPNPRLQPTLDPECTKLLDEAEGLGPHDAVVFARDSKVYNANWKLLVEGGLESYHFKIAHRDTVGPLFGDTSSTYRRYGDHLRLVLPRKTIRSLEDQPESEWRLLQHANVLYTLHPNASLLMQDGHFVMITMSPIALDQTRVDIATVGRAPSGDEYSAKAKAFLGGNHAFTLTTLSEDFTIAEQIQRGLASGANAQLRLATFERALIDFHEGLERRLHRILSANSSSGA